MGNRLYEPSVLLEFLTRIDLCVNVFDPAYAISPVFNVRRTALVASRQKYDVSRFRQTMKGLQWNEIDGGSVVKNELEAITTEKEALPRLFVFTATLPGLVVSRGEGGKTHDEAEEACVCRDIGNGEHNLLSCRRRK
jgi:hypothetical protein